MFWKDPVFKAIEERDIVELRRLGEMGIFFENVPAIMRIFYITIFFWRKPNNEAYLLAALRTKNVQVIDAVPFHFDPNTYLGVPSQEGKQDYKTYLTSKLSETLLDEAQSQHYLNLIPEDARMDTLGSLLNQMLNSEAHIKRLQILGGAEFSSPLLMTLLQTGHFALIDTLGFTFDANSHVAIQQHGGQLAYSNYCKHLYHKILTSNPEVSRHYQSCLPPEKPSPLETLLCQQLASPQPNPATLRRLHALGDPNFQNGVLTRVLATGNVALIDGLSLQFVPNSHEAIHQMGETSYRAYCTYLLEKMYQNLSSPAHFHNYMSLFPPNEPSPLETLFDRIAQEHEPAAKLLQLSQSGGAAFAATFMLKSLQTKNEDLLDLLYQFEPNSYIHIYQNWAALEGENGYWLYVQYLLVKISQNENNPEQLQRYLNCFPLQGDPSMPGVITQRHAKQLLLELKLAPLQEALEGQVEIDLDEWPHNEVYEMCEKTVKIPLYNSYCDLLIEKMYQNLLNRQQFQHFLESFPERQIAGLTLTQNAVFERLRDLILTKESRVEDLGNFYVLLGRQILMHHSLSRYMNNLYEEGKTTITDEEKELINCIIANEDFSDPQWVGIQRSIGILPQEIGDAFVVVFDECLDNYYQPVNPGMNSPLPGPANCASPVRK